MIDILYYVVDGFDYFLMTDGGLVEYMNKLREEEDDWDTPEISAIDYLRESGVQVDEINMKALERDGWRQI